MDDPDVIDFTATRQPPRGRSKTLLILSALVVGAAAAPAVAVGVHHLHRSDGPPPLVLRDGATAGPGGEGTTAAVAGPPMPIGGYRLDGPLPSGPHEAAVWHLDGHRATKEAVSSLAEILGVAGTPDRVERAWVVTMPDRQVSVFDVPGLPWSLASAPLSSHECPPVPILDPASPDQAVSSCAVAVPPNVPGESSPDQTKVMAAAREVLARLGLGTADVQVVPSSGQVVADPVVSGFPTVGFATTLTYDTSTTLVSASGWLGVPQEGATYPLTSAEATFQQLVDAPRTAIGIDCPPEAMCLAPWRVTGARLGLTLEYSMRGKVVEPVLVPAWLFAVAERAEPLAVRAVTPDSVSPVPPR